ncbi:hypothetical protein CRYUN_Cryun14cG0038100 [Craigia yunnanensis]
MNPCGGLCVFTNTSEQSMELSRTMETKRPKPWIHTLPCAGGSSNIFLLKSGQRTLDAYEEDCEFADPAGSFKGLGRFKRNCTNFGSLIEKSNMKLMKWETLRFCDVAATGYTEYYFDAQSGKVCRHVEHWNVPKMALLKQLLWPTLGFWLNRKNS